MTKTSASRTPLSPLESDVMDLVWRLGQATADDVHQVMADRLTNPSVRTILKRIEAKGLLSHTREGRAFVYRPRVGQDAVARGALQKVLEKFYAGSVEQLLVGLLDGRMTDRKALRRLAERAAAARRQKG